MLIFHSINKWINYRVRHSQQCGGWRFLVQPLCSKQGHLHKVARLVSSLVLIISKEGDLHNLSGQTVSLLSHPHSKTVLTLKCNFNLYLLSLPSLGYTEKSLAPSFSSLALIRYLNTFFRSPLSLLSPCWTTPAVSAFSCMTDILVFVALQYM